MEVEAGSSRSVYLKVNKKSIIKQVKLFLTSSINKNQINFFQLQGNTFMYFQVFKLVHCPYDYLTGNIKEHLFFYYQIQLT